MSFNPQILHPELDFATARSGGKGGQHVNKVETKVELRFDIAHSPSLPESVRAILLRQLAARLTEDGVLILTDQSSRSQWSNKEKVIKRFDDLIRKALIPVKRRKKTHVPPSVKAARRQEKERRSEIKKQRGKVL